MFPKCRRLKTVTDCCRNAARCMELCTHSTCRSTLPACEMIQNMQWPHNYKFDPLQFSCLGSTRVDWKCRTRNGGPNVMGGECRTWKCRSKKPGSENGGPTARSWLWNVIIRQFMIAYCLNCTILAWLWTMITCAILTFARLWCYAYVFIMI